MFKKVIALAVFCLFILFLYLYTFRNSKNNSQITQGENGNQITPAPTSVTKQPTTQISGSVDYQVNYLIVRPTDIIELYSNLEEKLTSSEIKSKYSCQSIVSGGFYTTEGKHIGLFYTQQLLKSQEIQSNLFNGFFTVDSLKNPKVSDSSPQELNSLRIALQAGPIIYANNKPKVLSSVSNEFARRILVAISNRGEITFIALSTKNNPVSGPKLGELPGIIKNLNSSTGLNIVDALNLDGGAHSVFMTDSANLGELSTIGSFFCIKPVN